MPSDMTDTSDNSGGHKLSAVVAFRPRDLVVPKGIDAGEMLAWASAEELLARHLELASETKVLPGTESSNPGTLKAGLVYFLLVFAVGWVLGPIRELWVVPHFGRMTSLLSEAPIMLIAMFVSAWWVIRRFDLPRTFSTTISMGLIAFGLLLPAEIVRMLWVRGLSGRTAD
jgi:hypothetical protein